MSVFIIDTRTSEHGQKVAEFLHDFERRTAQTLEQVDPDSPRGADLCRLYDVVEYPTIIATTEDGQLRQLWRGMPLPLIDEVSYYVQ